MGVSYFPYPAGREGIAAWLEENGLPLPEGADRSRLPTVAEIRRVLEALPDYQVEYHVTTGEHGCWEADVSWAEAPDRGPWTNLQVLNFTADESVPAELCFSRGSPEVVVLILERISRLCGPFVLVDDSAMVPLIVSPSMCIEHALRDWDARIDDV